MSGARSVIIAGLVFCILLATSLPGFAAGGLNGNVAGRVADSANNPVAGASVTIASPSGFYKQQTNSRGEFNFLTIPTDTYTISVEAKGFEPLSQTGITIPGDGTVELGTVRLAKSNELKQIVRVKARSQSSVFQPSQTVPQFTVSGSVLTAAQGKQSSASETDVLLSVPGFQVDKMGGLVLEGSTTDQVHFFFDGVDFTDPTVNGNGNDYFFNGVAATQIVPGAGDPSQGDSGAGSVNLVVKRGSYPGTGLLDAELLTRPFDHQLNFQYGIATKNNAISDFVSFFKLDAANQYGPWGSSIGNDTSANPTIFYNSNAYTQTADFINNFVFRFGKNQNQSLQFLYYENSVQSYDDVGGAQLPYDNMYGPTIQSLQAATALTVPPPAGSPPGTPSTTYTLPPNVVMALLRPEPGEGSLAQPAVCCGSLYLGSQPDNVRSTSLIKFEYDNQFNATTALALRYFNSNIVDTSDPIGAESEFPTSYPLSGGIFGGSRTGGIFELTKQADSRNLLTLSGSAEVARPNNGTLFGESGLDQLGPNAALFIRPANPNEPVSAANPCPVSMAEFPGACFLQQYYYKSGGTPYAPPLDLQAQNIQQFYGLGLRDQVQVNSKLRLDLGVRYDLIDEGFGPNLYYQDENTQPVPGSPSTYYVQNYGFTEEPHFIEPRLGASYKLGNEDSMAFTYGKSVNETGAGEQSTPNSFGVYKQFQDIPNSAALAGVWQAFPSPLTGVLTTPSSCYSQVPFPVGATASTPPSYKGMVGTTLQLGKPCASLAQLLYFNGDAYFPEITATSPAVFENYDFNFSHLFKNGSALRIAPFFRQGKDIQVATSPLVFNAATGVYSFGSLTNFPYGKNTTTGVGVEYTLPDRPYGFTGFVSATYVNEFTNTPPAGDNPYGQDFSPVVLPQSLATGALYRAGFVSPFTTNAGLSYKFRNGLRINPVIHFNIGYPYNAGSLTPVISSIFGAGQYPNTNLTDQFSPAGAPTFVDPADPGSATKPYISATRGTAETPSGGGLLSRPQINADLTLEYTPPNSRATFGVQIQDLFDNEYFGPPAVNLNYYAVSNGVAAPLTGQSLTGVSYPGLTNVISKDTYPYGTYIIPFQGGGLPAPTNFRLYFQYAL